MNQQEFGQHCSDLGDLETPENPLGQLRRSGKSSWTNHKGPASFIREGIVGKWGNGRLQGEFYVGDVSEVDRVGLQWSSDYAYAAQCSYQYSIFVEGRIDIDIENCNRLPVPKLALPYGSPPCLCHRFQLQSYVVSATMVHRRRLRRRHRRHPLPPISCIYTTSFP